MHLKKKLRVVIFSNFFSLIIPFTIKIAAIKLIEENDKKIIHPKQVGSVAVFIASKKYKKGIMFKISELPMHLKKKLRVVIFSNFFSLIIPFTIKIAAIKLIEKNDKKIVHSKQPVVSV